MLINELMTAALVTAQSSVRAQKSPDLILVLFFSTINDTTFVSDAQLHILCSCAKYVSSSQLLMLVFREPRFLVFVVLVNQK